VWDLTVRIEWEEFSSVKCSGGGGNERAVESPTIALVGRDPCVEWGGATWYDSVEGMKPTVISRGYRVGCPSNNSITVIMVSNCSLKYDSTAQRKGRSRVLFSMFILS
jgi:hypothetical protein